MGWLAQLVHGQGAVGVRRFQDLDTWKLTEAFKEAVHRIVLGSPAASRDLRYRGQILDASSRPSSDIAEGFRRFSPGDFARFLDYAAGSVAETEHRLHDGIRLDYFAEAACQEAFELANRSTGAIIRLKQSQLRYRSLHPPPSRRRRPKPRQA